MSVRRRLGAVVALSLLGAAVAGCGDDAPPREKASFTDVVKVDFDGGLQGDVLTSRNAGWAQVELVEVTNDTGNLESAPGFGGDGLAVRFPAYDRSDPPLASLALVNRAESDVLSPGAADFVFGADFALDARNQGNPVDDGNNVVQRGLFQDPGQYKIQVDRGVVSCRVAGTDGELIVKAKGKVTPKAWYRAACERTGDTVTLRLLSLADDPAEEQSWSESGPLGAVRMARADSPLAIGGKVTFDLGVSSTSSDQFNGLIDNVHVSFAK